MNANQSSCFICVHSRSFAANFKMSFADTLKSLLQEPPPSMAFEISEAGISVARIGARAELDFRPFKPGTLTVSPLKENVADPDEFVSAVRAASGLQASKKRRDVALILPDYCTRMTVVDFDNFPTDAKEQASLVRFRVKRSVPFDIDSAALSYFPQPGADKKTDVVVVVAPLEIVARYEAPFRTAGMNPGLVTTSSMAALDLAPEDGVSVLAKLTGHTLTVLVRQQGTVKLVRCLEIPSSDLEDVASVLLPTFVYIEDNLGGHAGRLLLCGFGTRTEEAVYRFQIELSVPVEPLRSPLGTPGENNAGLLGYLRSIAKNN
jgi:type IV pilus assembly protein PilM